MMYDVVLVEDHECLERLPHDLLYRVRRDSISGAHLSKVLDAVAEDLEGETKVPSVSAEMHEAAEVVADPVEIRHDGRTLKSLHPLLRNDLGDVALELHLRCASREDLYRHGTATLEPVPVWILQRECPSV